MKTDSQKLRYITGQPWVVADVNDLINVIMGDDDNDKEREPVNLVSQVNNISIIQVSGIINDSGIEGTISTAEIRDAFDEALSNTTTDVVLFIWDSGGGSIKGIPSLADYINKAKQRSSKTILSYTDTIMASGALWLGVQADAVFASKYASVGSMGAVMVTMDTQKALENQGIVPHVFTTGELKNTGATVGGHSEAQVRSLQAQVVKFGELFADAVKTARNLSDSQIKALSDAHTSIGGDAVKDGLVDAIMSLENVVSMYSHSTQPLTVQ